jgi:RNA-directed DNA polymerase
METRIEKQNQYLTGLCGYFALADTPSKFKEFDEWMRRRHPMIDWKKWKIPKNE